MENSIRLRVQVAARITAGALVASAGPALASMGDTGGDFAAVVGGVAIWVVCLFAGLVVALEGVIALVEEAVAATH